MHDDDNSTQRVAKGPKSAIVCVVGRIIVAHCSAWKGLHTNSMLVHLRLANELHTGPPIVCHVSHLYVAGRTIILTAERGGMQSHTHAHEHNGDSRVELDSKQIEVESTQFHSDDQRREVWTLGTLRDNCRYTTATES